MKYAGVDYSLVDESNDKCQNEFDVNVNMVLFDKHCIILFFSLRSAEIITFKSAAGGQI